MKTKEEVLEEILTINIGSAQRDRRDRMLAILAEFERECVKRGKIEGIFDAIAIYDYSAVGIREALEQELSKLKAE